MATDRPGLISSRPPGLVDVLDRILDKGLVIAGDIKVSLANVELLTLQIRLLICSIDKAEQIGLNWWRYDPNLTKSGIGRVLEQSTFPPRPPEGAVRLESATAPARRERPASPKRRPVRSPSKE